MRWQQVTLLHVVRLTYSNKWSTVQQSTNLSFPHVIPTTDSFLFPQYWCHNFMTDSCTSEIFCIFLFIVSCHYFFSLWYSAVDYDYVSYWAHYKYCIISHTFKVQFLQNNFVSLFARQQNQQETKYIMFILHLSHINIYQSRTVVKALPTTINSSQQHNDDFWPLQSCDDVEPAAVPHAILSLFRQKLD